MKKLIDDTIWATFKVWALYELSSVLEDFCKGMVLAVGGFMALSVQGSADGVMMLYSLEWSNTRYSYTEL